jgi:hypothetical protein
LSTRSCSGGPQRANSPRRAAWVARGSTWLQKAWGENHRPQDGAGGLVDDPQPTDLGAVGQGDPFRGINLPDLVGRGGPRRLRAWSPGWRGRRQPRVVEPAAQRARAGPGGLGPALVEGYPDQDGSPRRMLASQGQRGLADPVRIGMGQRSGRAIIGRHAVGTAVTEALLQVSHGAGGQAEGGREAGGRLPLLSELEQLPPHGDGDGLWHRWVLGAGGRDGRHPSIRRCPSPCGKTS